MSMRVKMAKALHDKMAEGSPGPKRYWEVCPVPVKETILGYVEALLDAMKEPTDAMIAKGAETVLVVTDQPRDFHAAKVLWMDMIDVIRDET